MPADGASARDVRRRGRPRDDAVTLTSRQQDDAFTGRLDDLGPGSVTGLGDVRRGRAVGDAARPAGTCPAWTSSWTAGCRSGPGCRARRRSSAPSRWAPPRSPGCRSTTRSALDLVKACMRAEPRSRAPPPAGWTRRSRCSARGATGAAARLPGLVDSPGAVGPGRRRSHAAGRRHPRVPLPRPTVATSHAARSARRPPTCWVSTCCATSTDQEAALDGPGRRAGATSGPARVHRDRPRPRGRRPASRPATSSGLGTTFTASHASLRDDYEVSCVELDVVVDVALDARCAGRADDRRRASAARRSRWCRRTRSTTVRRAVETAYDERGWDAPGFLTAVPSAGAREVTLR